MQRRDFFRAGKFGERLIRWLYLPLLAAVLIAPSELLATLPARQSRMMIVSLRELADRILETFRAASSAAGLECQSLQLGDDRAFQCRPSRSGQGFQGFVEAVEVKKHRALVISAYSSNLSTPHGELAPAVDLAMRNFRQEIERDPHVARATECVAPDFSACVLPP